MKRNVYKIIEETRKTMNKNYLLTCDDIETLMETNLNKKVNNIGSLLFEVIVDSFYLGYGLGKRATIKDYKLKNKF